MGLHGSSAFLETSRRQGWRQSSGYFEEVTYEGPTSGLETFLTSGLLAGFTEYSYEGDDDLTFVKAQYAWSAPGGVESEPGLVERIWEMDKDQLEKTLWEHPDVLEYTKDWTIAEKAQFRKKVEDILAGETTVETGTTPVDFLLSRLASGVEVFQVTAFVLRKTEVIRRGSAIRASYANINRVYDYAGILAHEPTLAGEALIDLAGLTTWQWRKEAPTITPTSGGLLQITQEYRGAEKWDTWIYKAAV